MNDPNAVSTFYGITIHIYLDRVGSFADVPHLRATYNGKTGLFQISNGELLDGEIAPHAQLLVRKWLEDRRDQIFLYWWGVMNKDCADPIDPLE